MNRGYVKVWRKFQDSFFYNDSEAVHLWLHILLSVNHKDREFMFNGKRQSCKTGSMITGMSKLSEITGINRSKIKRLLDMFESETLIETQRNNKFSIISVINWDEHQSIETQNETPVKRQRNASETPVNPNKNYKNDKNEKKIKEKIKKEKFGEFLNVLLTEDEREKLNFLFGYVNAEMKIENLSTYLQSTNCKKYKDHYATILSWARKNGENYDLSLARQASKKQSKEDYEKEKKEDEAMQEMIRTLARGGTV